MVKVQTKYVREIENIGLPYKREGRSAERERGRVGTTPKTDTSSAIYKEKPEIVTLDKTV